MTDIVRKVVAVVDDDQGILESMESLLESAGYFVRTFSSAADFLRADGPSAIDCLISHIGMPGITGFELLRLEHQTHPELPVILITRRTEMLNAPDRPHSSHCLAKPVDGKELLGAVTAALRQKGVPTV